MRGKISSEAGRPSGTRRPGAQSKAGPSRRASSYLGHDGLMRFVAEMTEDFEEVRFEIEETRETSESRLLVFSRVPGSRASERRRHQRPGWRFSEDEAGQDRLHAPLLGASRSPRSRRAVGVGDVAGERRRSCEGHFGRNGIGARPTCHFLIQRSFTRTSRTCPTTPPPRLYRGHQGCDAGDGTLARAFRGSHAPVLERIVGTGDNLGLRYPPLQGGRPGTPKLLSFELLCSHPLQVPGRQGRLYFRLVFEIKPQASPRSRRAVGVGRGAGRSWAGGAYRAQKRAP